MAAEALTSLAERVVVRLCSAHEELRVVLLHLIAEGRPVSPEVLADRLGWPAERVAAIVQGCSDTELDESGQIVGWGLSLLPTTHLFRLGERALFTWCALDTLMYPAILGLAADVSSSCPVTGTMVRLVVQPDGIANLQPAGAVVSIALPDAPSCACARDTFCAHSYYFASQEVAQRWQAARPTAILLSVADAAQVAREIAAERVRRAQQQ